MVDHRNPNLAEALRTLGFVQRFGVGIGTAQRRLSEGGHPPASFEVSDGSGLATLPAKATTASCFKSKGCVLKTSLVYHLAWMLAERGYRVLTCDLDS